MNIAMPPAGLGQEEFEKRYGTKTTEDLRLELRYREQSPDGDRDNLIERLENLRCKSKKRREDYERRYDAWHKTKLEATKPLFPLFTNLPVEIQTQIWKLSLPGPRLICPSRLPENEYYLSDRNEGTWPSTDSDSEEDEDEDDNEEEGHDDDEENDRDNDGEISEDRGEEEVGGDDEEKMEEDTSETEAQDDEDADVNDGWRIGRGRDAELEPELVPHLLTRDFRWMVFHNTHMAPNPSALNVCHLSREVAKTRYHACFGRPFLYIDHEIDILYFGSWCYPMWNHVLSWMKRWNGYLSENSTRPPTTYTDMQLIQRIAIEFREGYEFYDAENCEHMTPEMTGKSLRRQVARFRAVREVVLCETPELEYQYRIFDWESNVEPHQVILIEGPERAIPRYSCISQAEASACNVAEAFLNKGSKSDEEASKIPKVTFARLGLVGNLPGFEATKGDQW